MAAYILINCKFAMVGEKLCHRIEPIAFNSTVADLRDRVTTDLNLGHDFEMVYCGRYMRDSNPLSIYRVTPGCTIFLFKKATSDVAVADPLDETSVRQVVRAMKHIVQTRASHSALDRLLANPATLEELISATPSLGNNPVAMTILRDKELLILSTVVDKETMLRILSEHPALGHAALNLVSSVNAETVRAANDVSVSAATPSVNPRVRYGLDAMSDEEDEGEEEGAEQPQHARSPLPNWAGTVPLAPGGQITTDFFRQAMQMVYLQGSQEPLVAPQPLPPAAAPPPVSQAQLQQLRDMGIVNEALARRALEVTNGDIQQALEYIFGDEALV